MVSRCGGIGRHKGLKIPRSKIRTGSTPVSGTRRGVRADNPPMVIHRRVIFSPVSQNISEDLKLFCGERPAANPVSGLSEAFFLPRCPELSKNPKRSTETFPCPRKRLKQALSGHCYFGRKCFGRYLDVVLNYDTFNDVFLPASDLGLNDNALATASDAAA